MEDKNTVPTEWIEATFAAPRDRLTVRDGGTKKHRPKVRTVKPDAMPKVLRDMFANFPKK